MAYKYNPITGSLDLVNPASTGGVSQSYVDTQDAKRQYKTFITVGTSDADYVTDGTADQTEINLATAAASTAGGGIVFIKRGNYTISGSITVPTNVTLAGEGAATLITLANASNAHMIRNSDTTNGNGFVQVKDMKLNGNGSNQTSSVYGVYLKECNDSLVENVFVQSTRAWGIALEGESDANKNSVRNVVKHCTTTGCGTITAVHDGIYTIRGESNYIIECISYSNGRHGIHLNRSNNTTAANNTCYSNTGSGIIMFTTSDSVLQNNLSYSNTARGISMESGSHRNLIIGNTCRSNTSYGLVGGTVIAIQNEHNSFIGNKAVSNGDDGLVIYYSNYAVVTGNISKDNADQGMPVDNSKQCSITGNIIEGNKSEGIEVKNGSSDCTIVGNVVKNNSNPAAGGVAGTFSGIVIKTGITDCVITNNRCFDDQATKTQKYGIELQGTSDYCSITGNNVRGNLTGAILVVGSNNEIGLNVGY